MKKVSFISIIVALAGFAFAGCEYHHGQTFEAKEAAGETEITGEEVAAPSGETVVEAAVEDRSGNPSENPSEDPSDPPIFLEAHEAPKDLLLDSESADALRERLFGEDAEEEPAPPPTLVAVERTPPLTVVAEKPSFHVEPDTVIHQGSLSGDPRDGGSCKPTLLGAPRIGAGLAVTIDRHSLASYTRQSDTLTGLQLGCHSTARWDNPDEADWNASVFGPLVDGPDVFKTPVGHALVGIRLLKCETPFGPTAEYCGAEALFRRIHNDGTVEANLLSVRIPQNLDYFGPTSTWVSPQPERPDLTARCPDTDHVVTAIRYWQRPEIGGRGEGAVTGIEITCSHITR